MLFSIAGVMFLFGLTWLFGALTVTGFGDPRTSTAFQVLFVILNALQGFFIFLFFCVFNKDARELWLVMITCGHNKSKLQRPLQAKYANSGVVRKVKTASTNIASSNPSALALSSTTNLNSSTENGRMPLTGEAKETSMVTFKGSQEDHEADIDKDQKADFRSLEKSEGKDKALERPGSTGSDERGSPSQLREEGVELKGQVKCYSTNKAYKHHTESAEDGYWDNDSDGSNEPDDTNA